MTKAEKSNFESHEVVSPRKSGVRIVRLKLSVDAKARLSTKSTGIKSPSSQSAPKSPSDSNEDKAVFAG